MYFGKFHGPLSNKQSDWGAFGDYLGLFVNVANLVLILVIASQTIDSSERISKLQFNLASSQLRIEQLKTRPHLYISEKKSQQSKDTFSWYIQHTGEGPAINILTRFSLAEGGPFTKWIVCLSLGAGDDRELIWLKNAHSIELCYCDITETNCFQYIFSGRLGHTSTIAPSVYSGNLEVAAKNHLNTHSDLASRFSSGIKEYGQFFASLV